MQQTKRQKRCKHEIYNDHFQNYRRYGLPKAQLVIADIPYNIGKNAYGSNQWPRMNSRRWNCDA